MALNINGYKSMYMLDLQGPGHALRDKPLIRLHHVEDTKPHSTANRKRGSRRSSALGGKGVNSPMSFQNAYHPVRTSLDDPNSRAGRAQQRKKSTMASIPNCALILPQRYKKDFEERMEKKFEKKFERDQKTVVKRVWRPGGKKIIQKTIEEHDKKLVNVQRRLEEKRQQEEALKLRQPTQFNQELMEKSNEINTAQMNSYNLIKRAERFFNDFESVNQQIQSAQRVNYRQQKSEEKHIKLQKKRKHAPPPGISFDVQHPRPDRAEIQNSGGRNSSRSYNTLRVKNYRSISGERLAEDRRVFEKKVGDDLEECMQQYQYDEQMHRANSRLHSCHSSPNFRQSSLKRGSSRSPSNLRVKSRHMSRESRRFIDTTPKGNRFRDCHRQESQDSRDLDLYVEECLSNNRSNYRSRPTQNAHKSAAQVTPKRGCKDPEYLAQMRQTANQITRNFMMNKHNQIRHLGYKLRERKHEATTPLRQRSYAGHSNERHSQERHSPMRDSSIIGSGILRSSPLRQKSRSISHESPRTRSSQVKVPVYSRVAWETRPAYRQGTSPLRSQSGHRDRSEKGVRFQDEPSLEARSCSSGGSPLRQKRPKMSYQEVRDNYRKDAKYAAGRKFSALKLIQQKMGGGILRK